MAVSSTWLMVAATFLVEMSFGIQQHQKATVEEIEQAWTSCLQTSKGATHEVQDIHFLFREEDHTLYIAFRGSTGNKLLFPSPSWRHYNFQYQFESCDQEGAWLHGCRDGMQTHVGYTRGTTRVREAVETAVEKFLAAQHGPARIIVSGHSLGGALATLTAFDLVHNPRFKTGAFTVGLVTFASPRVGNAVWADHAGQMLKDAHRFVSFATDHPDLVDPVALVPSLGVHPAHFIEHRLPCDYRPWAHTPQPIAQLRMFTNCHSKRRGYVSGLASWFSAQRAAPTEASTASTASTDSNS